jgi:hypothetical protein
MIVGLQLSPQSTPLLHGAFEAGGPFGVGLRMDEPPLPAHPYVAPYGGQRDTECAYYLRPWGTCVYRP